MFDGQSLPQCWQIVDGPRDKIWDFVALVWPIRSRVIKTSQLLSGVGISWEVIVMVSQDTYIYHA